MSGGQRSRPAAARPAPTAPGHRVDVLATADRQGAEAIALLIRRLARRSGLELVDVRIGPEPDAASA